MAVFLSVAVKVRLPDRHSCFNLYPYVIKFSQAVFVCLSVSFSLSSSLMRM